MILKAEKRNRRGDGEISKLKGKGKKAVLNGLKGERKKKFL